MFIEDFFSSYPRDNFMLILSPGTTGYNEKNESVFTK